MKHKDRHDHHDYTDRHDRFEQQPPPFWPKDVPYPPSRHRVRPHWWPENEPFPPTHRTIKHGFYNRNSFYRMGCGMIWMNILVTLGVLIVFGGFALSRGWIHFPLSPRLGIPVVIITIVVIVLVFQWARRSFLRITVPLIALFDASRRVADGDYTVRVKEQGPRDVRILVNAFNAMSKRLQAADERRRSMLADVTHELRTPLTVIRGNLEGMLDGVYAPDEARLKSTLEEVQILSRLVDDLRTLALAESGAIQFQRETVDLAAFLAEAADAFQETARRAGVAILVEAAPAPVYMDPARMQQVLSNLIMNALHYAPAGGRIILHGETGADAQGGTSCIISVTDDGPGIPVQDLPHVFERFYKASDSGGMGLGLAIVKDIVEAHGGRVRVESREGQGTKFIIDLPCGMHT